MAKESVTEAEDFSCEVAIELDKLIGLGDLLTQIKPNCEFFDNTLAGVGHTIIGIAREIEKMTDSTYTSVYEKGKIAGAKGGEA